MKSMLTIATLIAATTLSVSAASAETHDVKATVPFAFQVGNVTLPAGTYTISSDNGSPLLRILNSEKRVQAQTVASYAPSQSTRPYTLVFEHYGNQYFLHQMVRGDMQKAVAITPSSVEKAAKRHAAEVTASRAAVGTGETVQIAAVN